MDYDPKSLRLVLQVAHCASISAGARASNMALAAASKRIADLEKRAGIAVFSRTPRGVALTPDGEHFCHLAKQVLSALAHLEHDLLQGRGKIQGAVRIAANASAIAQFLPEMLKSFVHQYPDMRLTLTELSSRMALQALIMQSADVAVVETSSVSSHFDTVPLAQDQLCALSSNQHAWARRRRLKESELFNHDHVALTESTALSQRLEGVAQRTGQPWRVRIRVGSFDAVCRLVAQGIGVAILPRQAIEPPLQALALHAVALPQSWAKRWHCAAFMPTQATSPATAALRAFIESRAQA